MEIKTSTTPRSLQQPPWIVQISIVAAALGGSLMLFGLLELWSLAILPEYRAIANRLTLGTVCLGLALLTHLLKPLAFRRRALLPVAPSYGFDTWIVLDRDGTCRMASSSFWIGGAPPCVIGQVLFSHSAWNEPPLRDLRDHILQAIETVITDGRSSAWEMWVADTGNCCMIHVTPHDQEGCVTIWTQENNSCNHLIRDRFFDEALDLFCVARPDGYFVHLNPRWQLLGYEQSELLQRPFLEFVHPQDRESTLQVFQKLLLGKDLAQFANRYRRGDGEYLWLSWTARRDSQSGLIYAVARDVTEFKATQLALESTLGEYSLLESALQLSPVSVFFIDRSGECTFCQGEVLQAGSSDAVIARGRNIFAQFQPKSESVQALQRVLSGEEQRWLVFWGGRYLEYHARPFRLNPDEVYGAVGIVQDITDQHRANHRLQSQLIQQAAVAQLGREALGFPNPEVLAQRAAELLAEVLDVEYCSLFELLPNGQTLILQAGVGWRSGLVGTACVGIRSDSLIGYTLDLDEPIVIEDFLIETRFSGPPMLHNHRIVSGVSLIVGEHDAPFGVLGIYSVKRRTFSENDLNFVQAITNVLSAAFARHRGDEWLHLMEQAIASTSTGIVIADTRLPDNPVTYVNPAFEKITGYSAAEVLGHNCRFLQGDTTQSEALEELRSALLEGRECNVLLKNYRRDGQVFWNNLYIAPIHDTNHTLTHFIGAQNDITDLVHTETALRESERRLDSILSSVEAVIWSIDAQSGRTLYLNPAGEAVYGRTLEEFYRDPTLWLETIHPEDRGRVSAERELLRRSERLDLEYRIIRPSGDVRWLYSRCSPIKNEHGTIIRFDCIDTDITDIKEAEEQLRHNAFYDKLTSLPNRSLFIDRLNHTIQRSKRRGGFMFAVLFLDLDGFKVVNDSLGHLAGDLLLVQIARRLEQCLRPSDTLARLGGDEFTILLEDIYQLQDATKVVNRVLSALQTPFSIFDRDVFTNVSIGIALGSGRQLPEILSHGGESIGYYNQPSDVLRDADIAMYRAKKSGKGCYCVFDREMHADAVARLQLETDLRLAIEADQLKVFYQPIVALSSGQISGFEALIRWQHPDRGFISPAEFIPIAEETGDIIKIGAWVLEQACQQLQDWKATFGEFLDLSTLTVAVNLSAKQLAQSDLLADIDRILAITQLPARSLKLEITESAIVENPSMAVRTLQALHERSITLCIDDFGTGYSSLSYLHRFPMDVLKIDRSFVTDIDTGEKNQEIVNAIVQLAHHLNMETIAEGIETEAERTMLEQFNCDFGQGYWFSRPVDGASATDLLRQQIGMASTGSLVPCERN
jgi:diguanylate cyclase (GGDEF)-like protein/PAS domain S-box-containing protein